MINLVIGGLGFGGAERVCIEFANYFIEYHNVDLYLNDLEGTKRFHLNPRINVIKFENIYELAHKLKNKKVLFFDYTIGIRVLFYNLIFRLNINSIVRLATYQYRIEKREKSLPYFKSLKVLLYYSIHLLFLSYFDHYIVLNKTMKINLIKRFKITSDKISVINNPIPNKFFEAESSPSIKPTILFVGRLIPSKGISDLLDIVDHFPIDTRVIIIGNGMMEPIIKKKVKNISAATTEIIYIPATTEIINFYKKATMLVLPSYREGSPNVLLEALAVGIPVVSYDCLSGPNEIIVSGLNGILVDLGDKIGLLNAINHVLKSKWDTAILKQSVEHHKIELIAKEYLSLILDM